MDREQVISKVFPEQRVQYSERDTMLYALGVGACQDPFDPADLRYVYEEKLETIPAMACVLAHPGGWIKEPQLALNWVKLLHAEQHLSISKPLAAAGAITGRFKITGLVDKGPESGVLMYLEKTLHDAAGDLVATVNSTYFFRGDGGCGNWGAPGPELPLIPDSIPAGSVHLPTTAMTPLVYRLSGDYNPIHADPVVARKAGFERPILHGLCTYGMACVALVRGPCGGDTLRFKSMGARFTKPVLPGETIRTEYWDVGVGRIQFRCVSVERDVIVMDRGFAEIHPAG